MNTPWQVIICRPKEKAHALLELLQHANIKSVATPLISIEIGKDVLSISNELNQLPPASLVFLLSPNIFLFDKALETEVASKIKKSFRDDLHYYAIGHSTANAFKQIIGLRAEYPLKDEISESLIKLPSLQADMSSKAKKNKQALLIRGNGGRQLIANFLKENYFNITAIEAYRREINSEGQSAFISALESHDKNMIVVTSGDMLTQLHHYIIHQHPRMEMKTFNSPLIVVSERIKQMALNYGWKKVFVAEKANNICLRECIIKSMLHAGH